MRVQVSHRAPSKRDGMELSLFLFLDLLHVNRIHRTLAETMEIRAHIVASGLVQGVGYRYFVFNRAKTIGLVGYVRNVFSGEVEIEIEGDRSLIEEFIKEVKVGPRSSQVKDLKIEWLNGTESYKSFEIR